VESKSNRVESSALSPETWIHEYTIAAGTMANGLFPAIRAIANALHPIPPVIPW
jgi:hypothetical protein